MMWWNGDVSGWGWALMMVGMVAFWVLIGFGIYWIVRATQTPREYKHDAQEILEERFARGEISPEEYDERRQVLAKR